MKNYPSAPARISAYRTVPRTPAERESGLLNKIHWPNFIKTSATIEGVSALGAVALKSPEVLLAGPLFITCLGGSALHDAHNYFTNNFRPTFPFNKLVKAKENEG